MPADALWQRVQNSLDRQGMEVTSAEGMHVDADGKQSPVAVMQQTLVPVPKTY